MKNGNDSFNETGSAVLFLSLLVAILSAVGILYGFSVSVDFNLLGNERKKIQVEQAAESAMNEIVGYYNKNLILLPKSTDENQYKKGLEIPEESSFKEFFKNANLTYTYDLIYVRKSIPLGESLGQTESNLYEFKVYIQDQNSGEVLTSLLGQFSRLKPVGGGVYGSNTLGGR